MPIDTVPTERFVGVSFASLDFKDAVAHVVAASGAPGFTTVITPNVDHIVRLDKLGDSPLGQQYRAAIADADLRFCDSRILSRLAKLRATHIPVVTGSDLTAALFNQHLADDGGRIALIGGDHDTLARLAVRFPGIDVFQHIPPMGLLGNAAAMAAAARFVSECGCRFIFLAVGNPQGEILAHYARQLGATSGVALSIGASIDFLTGHQQRAPRLIQRLGLEWAYRLLTEPRRLWRRYLIDGPRIFAIVLRSSER